MFNIITRTHNRPNFFKKCVESIKSQSYKDIHHIITYQSDLDLEYILPNKIDNTTLVKVPNVRKDPNLFKQENNWNYYHAPYNTFINEALKHLKEGWVMVLDDDDVLSKSDSLKILFNEVQNYDKNTNHLWRVKYTNFIVPDDSHFNYYSEDIYPNNPLQKCQISNIGLCYHSSNSKFIQYHQWSLGDYHAYSNLEKHIPKRNMINQVLTQIQTIPGSGNILDL